eukprot:4802114-Pyramimonas_sp.AAC.1
MAVGARVVGAPVGALVVTVGDTVKSGSAIQMAAPSNPQPLHSSASRTVVSHIRKGAAPLKR